MNHLRLVVGLTALLLGGTAGAKAQEDAQFLGPGAGGLQTMAFDQLSERHVSRQGDTALKMAGVTWEHGESTHFIFHTETGFSMTQLASLAERCYAGIKRDLGILQDSFERKGHIYVFLNEEAWKKFVGAGKLDAWTGGWCAGRELFFRSRPNLKFQGTTMPHELTHLVLHRFIPGDMPLWLNEGFAEFTAIRLERVYLKARDYTLTNVPDHLPRDRCLPLAELTAAIDYPKTKDEVAAFYIESQRLVHFLYHQHGGRDPLLKFLKLQSAGARFESAWRDVYATQYGDLRDFEDRFIQFLTKPQD